MTARAEALRLVLVLTVLGSTAVAREARADASGCSRDVSLGKPAQAADGTPVCDPGGDGCYECAYSHRGLGGYDLCAEPVDPSSEGGEICIFGTPNIPNWWPDPNPGILGPDAPPPGDPSPVGGPGDDNGGVDPGAGGSGDGHDPYDYGSYVPPSYLYPAPPASPYRPASS